MFPGAFDVQTGQSQPMTGTPTEVPVPRKVTEVVIGETDTGPPRRDGAKAGSREERWRSLFEDDELPAEEVDEGGSNDKRNLGEEGWKAESLDEKGAAEEAGEEADGGDEAEDSELDDPGVPARGEDQPGIEQVGDEIGEGEGDQVVDHEIALAEGVGDGLTIDGHSFEGGDHGGGEGQCDGKLHHGADHSADSVFGNLHENRRVSGEDPAMEGLAAGNFQGGGQWRLKRGSMIA